MGGRAAEASLIFCLSCDPAAARRRFDQAPQACGRLPDAGASPLRHRGPRCRCRGVSRPQSALPLATGSDGPLRGDAPGRTEAATLAAAARRRSSPHAHRHDRRSRGRKPAQDRGEPRQGDRGGKAVGQERGIAAGATSPLRGPRGHGGQKAWRPAEVTPPGSSPLAALASSRRPPRKGEVTPAAPLRLQPAHAAMHFEAGIRPRSPQAAAWTASRRFSMASVSGARSVRAMKPPPSTRAPSPSPS